ncbi:exo-alpha-sialidase [Rudanella paleaurantiibacter]|uniref:exo-alpha-sialidase n=1 Tax=Rudanella paleaurantiibacter TaxID=2614655 RepID=A0A7J5TT56_9BACT|nr:sialidase family protein [Rudanella paleaurantiibacter]KAB7726880.1 exo-alpha-sialidase [Rudanella paleaurantiibacter]
MIRPLLFASLLLINCRPPQPAAVSQTNLPVSISTTPPDEVAVFRNGDEGYGCYRIPAVVKAPDGALLAFAEGRRTDCGDFGDVDIVLRISRDNGKTWGPQTLVADYGTAQAGNPAPVFDLTDPRYPAGRLFLVYNTGVASESDVRNGKAIREVWYKTSTDGGKTWSAPVNITTQVNRPNKPAVNPAYAFADDWRSYANTPGHALQLAKGSYRGRLFVAANHSAGAPQSAFRDYRAHAFYSDDHGQTWKLSPDVDYAGGNESTAAETSDGGVLMNIRNQSGDVKSRLMAWSPTAGAAWNPVVVSSDLPDPVCQGSMVNYQTTEGRSVLLFSNPNSQTKREKLTVRYSTDDGKSWSRGREVYSGSAAYSDLVVQADGQIGVLYERDNYTLITYAHFPYTWLTQ